MIAGEKERKILSDVIKEKSAEKESIDKLCAFSETEEEINPTIDDIPIYDNPFEEEKKNNVVKFDKLDNMSAHRIWGVVLVKLREARFMSLHTAGGEVRDISLEGNKLIAKVKQENLYNILTEQENFDRICLQLKELNDNLSIEFVFDPPKVKLGQTNLPKVKKLFGEFLQTNE